MRPRLLPICVLAWLPLLVVAGPTTPPFTQCPPVGADTGCAVLIIYNPDGTVTVKSDPSQGPYDQIEDTLVGVQNNSSSRIFSISISGSGIFAFDGDGICGTSPNTGNPFNPRPSGCPFGPTGYEGPGVSFTITNSSSGRVTFANGIPPGQSAYFSLEEAVITVQTCGTGNPLQAEMSWTDSCPANGPPTITDVGYVKGQRLNVNWDRSGLFGTSQQLQAQSGDAIELWCGTLPNKNEYQYLLFYTASGLPPHVVGECVWPNGCNSAFFTYTGLVSNTNGTNSPGCFASTQWISRDYGDNTVVFSLSQFQFINYITGVPEHPPALDWFYWNFNATTQSLSKTDVQFQYKYGPPVPLCNAPTPQGQREGAVLARFKVDPQLGTATDIYAGSILDSMTGLSGVALPSNRSLADINGDGSIDMNDFVAFQHAFGACAGMSASYNPYADLDGDGCVTFKDYQIWYQFYKSAHP